MKYFVCASNIDSHCWKMQPEISTFWK